MVIALVAVLIVGAQSVFTVGQWEQALIIQMGQYRRALQEPGLHWKIPFVQQVHKIDRRILSNDSESSEYLTLDRKRVLVNHVTRWRINEPLRYFITVRDEAGARARLDDLVFSELRREIASRDFGDLIAEQREPAMEAVAARTAERANQFGIDIVDVRIKRADLPTEVQASVFARMVAERERIAKRYRSEGSEESLKITAETDKEKAIILATAYEESQRIRGKGDAVATRVYGEEFGKDPEFYSFVRSLEAYEKTLGEGSTILLSPDSRLLRYLTDSNAKK